MYVQSYQIHNVLSVFRKQLSQKPDTAGKRKNTTEKNDRVQLAYQEHRQSLIDKVSAEIVDRMAQAGPQKRFKDKPAAHMGQANGRNNGKSLTGEVEFTYNAIDEHNRKISNSLPVEKFNPFAGRVEKDAPSSVEESL